MEYYLIIVQVDMVEKVYEEKYSGNLHANGTTNQQNAENRIWNRRVSTRIIR